MREEHRGVSFQTVNEDEAGARIDNFLIRVLKGVPKSMIYRILRKGEVRVNKKRIKPEYKLQAGDEIRIPPLRMSEAKVVLPSANLDRVSALKDAVLYENDGLMVINKPCFMPVHGGSGVSYGVIEALRSIRPELHFLELAHRLDRETSGCLIVAKKRSVLRQLHEQFREKNMQKQYLALVRGVFSKRITTVRAPLAKNVLMSGERVVRVDEVNGKPSVTDFKIRENFRDVTLVEAYPHTGRTHQIRVHLAYRSHPILGDDKYGDREFDRRFEALGLDRMFLHAEHITFTDPVINREITVYAPLPGDLENLLSNIRKEDEEGEQHV
ncbi:23S rRNA pseudouridine(955/2504/2580) synthase RluC [Ruminobacter amylophilus]|uniref:23S rRNA pseudouridine(955/2504/2580) synthase RluC n=1 Tax=Ruminobacter amylophilus TaxID=867 RepID=UPI000B815D07|nr:23S rRNA pseudouridine(955/2504/2580) synthase RluC [Ruminobacter amylophilus]